jgi:TonB-linked SusC/RagA family outer membrane protein
MRNFYVKIFNGFLLLFFLVFCERGFSQVQGNSKPLKNVLEEVTAMYGTRFVYEHNVVAGINSSVNPAQLKGKPVEEVLKLVLYPHNLLFLYIDRNHYTIVRRDEKSIAPPAKPAGTEPGRPINTTAGSSLRRIAGIVLNEKEQPLPGVSLTAQRAGTGTMSDANGQFGIDVKQNDLLQISFVGYQSQEINIASQSSMRINMKTNQKQLDEVVIIGYGTTTQRKSTGSVSSITAAEIGRQPVANPLASLPGRIAGTLVAQNNGLPGSAIQLQIRGQNSLSSGTIPLYVIDGVPFTNFNGGSPATDNLNAFGTSGANGGVSPFSMINPNDIERIDILKDADATSIYGSRGANGVVLITTKKGKAGKTKLDVNLSTGFTGLNRTIPMMNLKDYLQMRREAFANDGVTPNVTTAPDLLVWDTTRSADFQDLLIGGTGHVADAQTTLSGGDSRLRFLFNAGYRRESTVFPGDNDDRRFATRLNVDHNSIDNRFNISLGVSYSNAITDIITSDLSSVYNLPPNLPLYDANNKLFWSTNFTNPLANLLKKYYGNTTNLIGNAALRYTVMPGLNIKTTLGYTITDLDQRTSNPASSQNPVNNPVSSAVFSDNTAKNWIIEPTAEYVTNISAGKLTALLGGSWQHNTSNGKLLNGANYSSEALLGTLSAAGTVTVSYNNIVEYKYAAFFGQLNYDWKGKYLVNGTFRRDASSRFGPNNRFGNFGAIGAAWVFSEENFMKDNLSFLSFGKLRGSFGTTGNDQISNYIYLPLYSPSQTYQAQATISPVTLPNADIQWETTRKLEAALDLGFIKDRIIVTANYYRNRSSDLLAFLSLATQSGYNSIQANMPALVQNTGLELELNTVNITSKDLKWTTSLNITFPKNKLVEFPGLEKTFSSGSYIVGKPLVFSRVYHYLGVDPATGKAMYEDIDKNNVINTDDRYVAKIGTPYYGGLNNTLSYKNWTFNVFFQFNHRYGTTNILNTRPGILSNQNTSYNGRWRKPGDITSIPGATTTTGTPIYISYAQYTQSDAVWGDASYVKFRTAALSYDLPAKWAGRIKMSNFRAYVQAQNLFTWAKNDYILDPETTVQGGPSGLGTGTIGQVLPPLRTIMFGINCSF